MTNRLESRIDRLESLHTPLKVPEHIELLQALDDEAKWAALMARVADIRERRPDLLVEWDRFWGHCTDFEPETAT